MRKIIVIGCPGSGKTTFAEKLQRATNLPLYYLDAIWHKPDKVLPRIYELLEKYRSGKTVIIFKSREEADEYIHGI